MKYLYKLEILDESIILTLDKMKQNPKLKNFS